MRPSVFTEDPLDVAISRRHNKDTENLFISIIIRLLLHSVVNDFNEEKSNLLQSFNNIEYTIK